MTINNIPERMLHQRIMTVNKLNNISSWLIIILLLSQVGLSIAIILRLRNILYILFPTSIEQVSSPTPFVKNVSIDDDPKQGVDDAQVTIIEFSDYQCPYCADADKSIKTLLDQYNGKILFVYRDFPLKNSHQYAFQAAEAADCAGKQNKYWEMHDVLFINQENLDTSSLKEYATQLSLNQAQFDLCLANNEFESEINKDLEDGKSYGVTGTPTFFINGYMMEGGTIDQLRQAIESALQNKYEITK
ncbi:MAG: DsbA family protein [Anaerolineales bacterium]